MTVEKDLKAKMQELIDAIDNANRAYYKEAREIMTNFEYDRMYDELRALEDESGIILSGSPTQQVGYEIASNLPKEAHPQRMLSLDKTKSVEELQGFLGDKTGLLSWKMDGLTVVLTFEDGKLAKAVTRGNGDVGEVITANARTFVNVPVSIPFKGRLVVRGEAFISYSTFEEINRKIPEASAQYKNPRNLCSGSVRQLDSKVTAERKVRFNAFSLYEIEGAGAPDFKENSEQMEWLKEQGLEIVYYRTVTAETLPEAVSWFAEQILTSDMPSDGLVLEFDDIAFGESLGVTAKYPKNALAFKWQDETAKTTLREIEWSPSRTGLINPVAVFDSVELEGTTVSRASVHNLSVVKDLKLGIGDTISVYKANMIIPQIAEDLTGSDSIEIPETCPACGGATEVRKDGEAEELYCTNPACPAKEIKSFGLFVGKTGLNIDGLSEATLEKFLARGFLKTFDDVFHLDRYREEIQAMEGMGQKSYDNLQTAVDNARTTTCDKLLCSLGIPGIGPANARSISKQCGDRWENITALTAEEAEQLDGVGEVMAKALEDWFAKENNRELLARLLPELTLEEAGTGEEQVLDGLTFVITGSLTKFENRDALKARLLELGAKVSGSVSKNTNYLINNDVTSGSSKNKKAKDLEVPIVSEEDLLGKFPQILQ